jgi:4-amino-4-deoxy-L-arabinose transferase-like glycosyltransferase
MVQRCIGLWYDRERDGRATWILLALFVAAWTAFHVIVHSPVGLHPDLLEAYAWSRHPAAGYYKHPPVAALVPAAWFAVFPAANWAFHLLAMCNAALALYAVDRIARRYVIGDKRLLVLLLLLLLPFYQFHAQRFSTNPLLLSTWPIATYCFLRAFEARSVFWSAAAGAAAALAMLTKYYSVYLVAAFFIAALSHPARWAYLKSPSPWISAAVGLAILIPHLHWLTTVEFGPFEYAYLVHGNATAAELVARSGNYLLGAIGYSALPVIVYVLASRPDRRALADALWPTDPDRRLLVVLLAVMLLLPAFTAPLIGLEVSSLWTMSAWFLLPIVLLAPDAVIVTRPRAVQVAALVAAITLAALAAAPVLAWRTHKVGTKEDRAYYRPLSEALARQWRSVTTQPLRIVLSTLDLSSAITFYHPDHPDCAPGFDLRAAPWITAERLRREGWAAVCPSDDRSCIHNAELRRALDPNARRVEIEITPRYFGDAGKSKRYVVVLAPPLSAAEGRSPAFRLAGRPQ